MLSDTRHNHVLIVEDDQGRHEHILEAPLYLIGRDPKCDIRLISQFVSRCHARLIQVHHDDWSFSYSIVDGNQGKPSANGLLINGRKLQAYKLQDEDEIVFGPNVTATYYLLRRDGDRPFPDDDPLAPVGSGGGDDGNPNDSAMASPY